MSKKGYKTPDSPSLRADSSSGDSSSSNSPFSHQNGSTNALVSTFQLSPTDANNLERVVSSGVLPPTNSNLDLSRGTNQHSLPIDDAPISSDGLQVKVLDGLNHQPFTIPGISPSISETNVANTTMSYDNAAKSKSISENSPEFQSIINSNIINEETFPIWEDAFDAKLLNPTQRKYAQTYFNKDIFLDSLSDKQNAIHQANMKDLPRPLQNSFYLNYIYRTEYQLLFKIPEELSNYSLKEIDVLIETELHLSAEELEPEINKVEAKCSLIETKLEQNNNTLKELNAANIINKKQLEECTKNKKSLDQEYGQEIQNLFYLVIKQLILNTVVTLYHDDLHVILDIMQTNYNRTRIFRKRDIKTSEKVNPQSFLLEFMENHQFRRENNTSVQFSFVTNDTPVALYLELPFHEIERYEELFRDHFPKDAKYEIIDSYIPPEVQSALDNPHFMNNHEKLVRIYYVVILTSGQTPFKHRKHHHKDVKIEFMSYLSFCGRWHTTDHNKFKCPHFKKVNAHPARGQKRQ